MKEIDLLFKATTSLLNHNDEDWLILQAEAEQFALWSPELVQTFFDTLYSEEDYRQVFIDGERPALEKIVAQWFIELPNGFEQEQFWEQQWIIVIVHIQRNISCISMLAMMNRVQQLVMLKCVETYDKDKACEVYNAFLRITGMITVLTVKCYEIFQDNVTEEGLTKVGLSPKLLQRIREMQFDAMMDDM